MDAHLRMAIRVAGLMLVDAHELIFEYVLMLWSQLNMDLEQVLMPVGLGCAVRSSAIFCDGSIDLPGAEAPPREAAPQDSQHERQQAQLAALVDEQGFLAAPQRDANGDE